MSRNRMKNSQSLHWMGVMKWIMIVGLLSILGLSYMYCKNRNSHAAEEVSQLKDRLAELRNRNATLAVDLEKMKGIYELQRRLAEMHSNLVKWGDSSASWEQKDQSTRMRLEHITHLNSAVTQADATSASPVPH